MTVQGLAVQRLRQRSGLEALVARWPGVELTGEGGAGNRLTAPRSQEGQGQGQGGEDCTSVFSKSQPTWDSVQSREEGTGFSGSDASRSVWRGGWAAAPCSEGRFLRPV